MAHHYQQYGNSILPSGHDYVIAGQEHYDTTPSERIWCHDYHEGADIPPASHQWYADQSNMEVSTSSYVAERRYQETSYGNLPSYQADSSTVQRSHQTQSAKDNKNTRSKAVRRFSGSSAGAHSDTSAVSKGSETQTSKKVKENEHRKLLMGRAKSGSLADRWQRMISEYQDTYVDTGNTKQEKNDDSREKSRKLSDMSKYDSVKQVFGKRMTSEADSTMPKSKDIETESVASAKSSRSWRLGKAKSPKGDRKSLQKSKSTPDLLEESETRRTSRVNQHRKYNNNAGDKGARQRSRSEGRHVSYLSDSHADNDDRQKKRDIKHKNRKRDKGLHRNATDIVDDVIDNALDFLYGSTSRRKSKHTSKSRAVRNIQSDHLSSDVNSGTVQRNIVDQRTSYSTNTAGRTQKSADYRATTGSMPNLLSNKADNKGEVYNKKKVIRSSANTHRNSAVSTPHLDAAMKHRSDRGYDLGIGGLGYVQSQASPSYRHASHHKDSFSSYSAGQPSWPSSPRSSAIHSNLPHKMHLDIPQAKPMYSGESDYSTSFDIKNRQSMGSGILRTRHNSGPDVLLSDQESLPLSIQVRPETAGRLERGPGRVNPPTLTKGTVTKVMCGNESIPSSMPQTNLSLSPIVPQISMSPRIPQTSLPQVSSIYSVEEQKQHEHAMLMNSMLYPSPSENVSASPEPLLHTRFTTVHNWSDKPEKTSPQASMQIGPVTTRETVNLNQQGGQKQINEANTESVNSSEAKLPTIDEMDEGRYAAFSNEPMIVSDLMRQNKGKNRMHTSANYVVQDNLYGTEPAINMNTKQNLNLFIFNQKKDSPKPAPPQEYIESSHMQSHALSPHTLILSDDQVDSFLDRERELRERTIFHKQTQTIKDSEPNRPPRKQKKMAHAKSTVSPSVKHKETTHYITTEREIEKLPQERPLARDTCVQTDPPTDSEEETMSELVEETKVKWEQHAQVPMSRLARAKQGLSETTVTHVVPQPIITESRQMESLVEYDNQPSPEPTCRSIPIQKVERESVVEKLITNTFHGAKHEEDEEIQPEEDEESEEEILETTVIEEKEQRIAMAIFEEVEFSAQRTAGGKTVDLDIENPVPNFWLPDKWEGVVERKRQKKTEIKNIEKEDDFMKWGEGPNAAAVESGMALPMIELPEDVKPKVHSDRMVQSSKTKKTSPSNQKIPEGTEESFWNSVEQRYDKKQDIMPSNATPEMHSSSGHHSYSSISTEGNPAKANLPKFFQTSMNLPEVPHRSSNRGPDEDKFPDDIQQFENIANQFEKDLPAFAKESSQHMLQNTANQPKETAVPLTQTSPKHKGKDIQVQRRKQPGPPVMPRPSVLPSTLTSSVRTKRVTSNIDPANVSFGKKSGKDLVKSSEDFRLHPDVILNHASNSRPIGGIEDKVVHTEQTEPSLQTKIVKDDDGNLVKITELSHTLTKTVEYDEKDKSPKSDKLSKQLSQEEMHEGSYIDLDLVETINEEGPIYENCTVTSEHQHRAVPEVVSETSVSLTPVDYDVRQSSLRLADDGTLLKDHKFIYDSRTAKLNPLDSRDKVYPYETMTTAL